MIFNNLKMYLMAFFVVVLQLGCTSTSIFRDKDYNYSLTAARQGKFDLALTDFPKHKEQGGFITTVEKAYLKMWDGSTQSLSDYAALQELAKSFGERQYISISRESSVFFFQESPDGYIPSEHEVIVLHLLSAQIQLKVGKIEEAQVELRRASYLLQGSYSVTPKGEEQNKFDDPSLRVWAGSLWANSGDWQSAQVDFRRAAQLLKNPEDRRRMQILAELPKPPGQINLTFSGVGPDLRWNDSNFEPEFIQNAKAPTIQDWQQSIQISTQPWYRRHLERNSLLRDVLVKSNYMTQFIGVKAEKGMKKSGAAALVGSVKLVGVLIVVGATVTAFYLVSIAGNGSGDAAGYIIGGGFLVAKGLWDSAEQWDNELNARISEDEKRTFEDMRTYRFVRYLPQWISIKWQENQDSEVGNFEIPIRTKDATRLKILQAR